MRALTLPVFLLLAACSAGSLDPTAPHDPYEPLNRQVHAFNKGLDARIVRPITQLGIGEDKGTPNGLAVILKRVGGNLSLPGKSVNHLLQGKPDLAWQNSARFVVNSTIGILGLHDVAGQEFDLAEADTDFGQTLAVWGVPEGAYLELPVIGPSTTRDAAGRVVDWVIDPMDQVLNKDQAMGATIIKLGSKAGDRVRFGDTVDSILHDSADSYVQARLLYLMHRRHELGQESAEIDPYEN